MYTTNLKASETFPSKYRVNFTKPCPSKIKPNKKRRKIKKEMVLHKKSVLDEWPV